MPGAESPRAAGGRSEVAGRAPPHTAPARLRAPRPPARSLRVPTPCFPAAPAAPTSQTSASRAPRARAADPGSGRDPEPWPPRRRRNPGAVRRSPWALRSRTAATVANRSGPPRPRHDSGSQSHGQRRRLGCRALFTVVRVLLPGRGAPRLLISPPLGY